MEYVEPVYSKGAHKVAEQIQRRFRFDENAEFVVSCPDRFMSDILGSDWIPEGLYIDNQTPVDVFYALVRRIAERKYGPLPY